MADQDIVKQAEQLARLAQAGPNTMEECMEFLIQREHPTNQQTIMRFFMRFVEGMAGKRGDGRNEASIALAKEIMKIEPKIRVLPRV